MRDPCFLMSYSKTDNQRLHVQWLWFISLAALFFIITNQHLVKVIGATHEFVRARDNIRIATHKIMYAESIKAYEKYILDFKASFEASFPVFVAYFETPYHNKLKSLYFTKSRNKRVNRVAYTLVNVNTLSESLGQAYAVLDAQIKQLNKSNQGDPDFLESLLQEAKSLTSTIENTRNPDQHPSIQRR
ncbi:hypothetical protein AB4K20DRAFT_1867646 [Rhizopus microsporus]